MQTRAVEQFNQEQLGIIRSTVAKNTSPEQFRLFIEVCKYHALNPFARQIYAVVRQGQMTIQTSIDGYRLLAERSGKYAGQIGPEWCGDDGVWKDVWLDDKPPVAARIGVLRKDFERPTWGVAKFKSYAQTGSPTWSKMPDVMLAKCAESLALRKAFPAEMSGIYTAEEMQQADQDLPTVAHLHPVTVESEQPQQEAAQPPVQTQQTQSQEADQPISEQQLSSIRKLCEYLNRPEPGNVTSLTFLGARKVIQQLTADYKEARQNSRAS
jgi:phage recombination protein Bet